MLEDIKNKINDNAKEIGKEINNSASAVSGMAKSKGRQQWGPRCKQLA